MERGGDLTKGRQDPKISCCKLTTPKNKQDEVMI